MGQRGVEERIREEAIYAGTAAGCQEWAAQRASKNQQEWDERISNGPDPRAAHYSDRRYSGGIKGARVHSFLCAELGDANAIRRKLPYGTWANLNQVGPGRADGKLFYDVMDK